MAFPVGGYYLASEGSATSASNFEWYCKSILGPEAAAHAASHGQSIYEVCGERVRTAMDRPNDILFFPFLFGGPSGAPAGLLGLRAEHDGADVLRAIFEGIVFSHKLDTDALLTGADSAKVTSICLAGGAVNSSVWCQMFADILGLRVEVTEGNEVGARGTAMCAAVALGIYADMAEAMKHMVRIARVYEPNPQRQAAYARKFKAFSGLAQALPALCTPAT
jgi:L-xylulokinase